MFSYCKKAQKKCTELFSFLIKNCPTKTRSRGFPKCPYKRPNSIQNYRYASRHFNFKLLAQLDTCEFMEKYHNPQQETEYLIEMGRR